MWWQFLGESWLNCWRSDAHEDHWWRGDRFCVGIKEEDEYAAA